MCKPFVPPKVILGLDAPQSSPSAKSRHDRAVPELTASHAKMLHVMLTEPRETGYERDLLPRNRSALKTVSSSHGRNGPVWGLMV